MYISLTFQSQCNITFMQWYVPLIWGVKVLHTKLKPLYSRWSSEVKLVFKIKIMYFYTCNYAVASYRVQHYDHVVYGYPTPQYNTHQISAMPYKEFNISPCNNNLATTLWQSNHSLVTVSISRLSQCGDKLVTTLLQSCHQVVINLVNKLVTTTYNLVFSV